MAKSIRNNGKTWTKSEVKQVLKLAAGRMPTRLIGKKLGRTANAIRSVAQREGISLKETSRSSQR
jgi:hypothetical protein